MAKFFAEYWFQGWLKDYLKILTHEEHPHITLTSPFHIISSKEQVQELIVSLCKKYKPIPFTLEGKAKFEETMYVPIVNCRELKRFYSDLELALINHVIFVEKLNPTKILYVNAGKKEIKYFKRQDLIVNQITFLKDKKLWFVYDFETKKVLTRKQELLEYSF